MTIQTVFQLGFCFVGAAIGGWLAYRIGYNKGWKECCFKIQQRFEHTYREARKL